MLSHLATAIEERVAQRALLSHQQPRYDNSDTTLKDTVIVLYHLTANDHDGYEMSLC